MKPRHVQLWLCLVASLVFLIIIVGGITRLTESGLSIVEWKPVTGVLPPLTLADWKTAFAAYQNSPEYHHFNQHMTLGQFKVIFFWEYLHRLLGRLVGLVFFVPYVFILFSRSITLSMKFWLGLVFVLGGLQGFLGWYMVKSGLVSNPYVSHLRLTAHLCLAVFIIGFILLLIGKTRETILSAKGVTLSIAPFRMGLRLLTILIFIQIAYGALMAGLHAGHVSNTFPLMYGEWVPTGLAQLQPLFNNFVNNPIAIHFIHRLLGWTILIYVIALWIMGLWAQSKIQNVKLWSLHSLMALVTFQFLLGVSVVLFSIPIALASMHQVGAILLFGLSIIATYKTRKS